MKREAEASEFEDQNQNAKKTLMMFGFKYSEIISIVVKYEKLIERVRLMMPLEAIKSTETHENH
jgi:hypothetical protein